jgi:hypothetical protein
MDHVVYVDAKAGEMEKLINKEKKMIIRGAVGRKMPYGRVNPGDMLYLINNNAEGVIKAKTIVTDVFTSEKMTQEESINLVEKNQDKLYLTDQQFKRWAGKRYLVLVEVGPVAKVTPFQIDKNDYSNLDDWLPVGDIGKVRCTNS